jgi:hypothetical protein
LLKDGREAVLRIAGSNSELAGGIYWNRFLKKLLLPIPEILVCDCSEHHYSIHKKIEGRDLWFVYNDLSSEERRDLAIKIVDIQNRVERCFKHDKFGYAVSLDDSTLKDSWSDIIWNSIVESEGRIIKNRIFDSSYVKIVKSKFELFKDYLDKVESRPFLDDLTTKNVLIHNNRLSGIVDIDTICFGDKLSHLGLTKMAFLSLEYDLEYIDYFIEAYQLSTFQIKIVNFYTLLSAICFMSETGERFNKNSCEVDPSRVELLKRVFNDLTVGVGFSNPIEF